MHIIDFDTFFFCFFYELNQLNASVHFRSVFLSGGAGQGGGRPGEKGAGGVREAGDEGAGSGIPKVVGSGRKREKLCNIAQKNAKGRKKCKGAGAKKYRAGTGIKGYGKREV